MKMDDFTLLHEGTFKGSAPKNYNFNGTNTKFRAVNRGKPIYRHTSIQVLIPSLTFLSVIEFTDYFRVYE
jgi:hypothetical protein